MSCSKVFRLILKCILISALIPVSFSKQKQIKGYNERCVPYDFSASCDSDQGLVCIDSGLKGYRCQCPSNKLHSQIFDRQRSTCVGKVFNSCVLNSKAKSSAINESLCVSNAHCESKLFHMPVCVCKPGFTEDEGSCVPTLKHGESCYNYNSGADDGEPTSSSSTSTTESATGDGDDEQSHPNKGKKCDEKHGQICLHGKCQCRFPSEQYYDAKEEKCVSFAGGQCTHGDGHLYSCVPHARCNAPPFRLQVSASHHHRAPGIGLLPPLPPFIGGLVQAAAASASASAGSSTAREGDDSGDEDTTIFMMPLRPRLPPPPPPHPFAHVHGHHHPPAGPHHETILSREDPLMEFDSGFDNFDFARSIFFGPGSKKSGLKDGDEPPRCQCLPGYSKTSDGFCALGHGSKCNPDEDDSAVGSCNADQYLECLDAHDGSFTCQCRNLMNERFDTVKQECVAMMGRHCRPVGKYPMCESGDCISGICQCSNGTSLTPMGQCKKAYQENCNPGECNGYNGLTCHGSKTCQCVDSYLRFDAKMGACVADKGSACGTMPSNIVVGCENGTICKEQEIGGKKMSSRCV